MTPFDLVMHAVIAGLAVLLTAIPRSIAGKMGIEVANVKVIRFAGILFLGWIIVRLLHGREFEKFDIWEALRSFSAGACTAVVVVLVMLSNKNPARKEGQIDGKSSS